MRRLSVLLLGAAALFLVRRRRGSSEWVELTYDDGSTVRLDSGVEASDLLRDAREIAEAAVR